MTPDLAHTAYLAIEAQILSRQLDASDLRAVVGEVVRVVADKAQAQAEKDMEALKFKLNARLREMEDILDD